MKFRNGNDSKFKTYNDVAKSPGEFFDHYVETIGHNIDVGVLLIFYRIKEAVKIVADLFYFPITNEQSYVLYKNDAKYISLLIFGLFTIIFFKFPIMFFASILAKSFLLVVSVLHCIFAYIFFLKDYIKVPIFNYFCSLIVGALVACSLFFLLF